VLVQCTVREKELEAASIIIISSSSSIISSGTAAEVKKYSLPSGTYHHGHFRFADLNAP